jgi:GxxExxY protein
MPDKSKRETAEAAEISRLTDRIIAASSEIHRTLGPGLLESAYEECLCYELTQSRTPFQRQVPLPLPYKGLKLDCGYRLDFLVGDAVIVEIKAIDELWPIHSAQLLTYLKALNQPIGLLINFNAPILKKGLRRIANHYVEPSAEPLISASSALEKPTADVGHRENAETSISQKTLRLPQRLSVSAVNSPPRVNPTPAPTRRPH